MATTTFHIDASLKKDSSELAKRKGLNLSSLIRVLLLKELKEDKDNMIIKS